MRILLALLLAAAQTRSARAMADPFWDQSRPQGDPGETVGAGRGSGDSAARLSLSNPERTRSLDGEAPPVPAAAPEAESSAKRIIGPAVGALAGVAAAHWLLPALGVTGVGLIPAALAGAAVGAFAVGDKKTAWVLGGSGVGAVLGGILGGPVGMAVGGILGGVAGHFAGKMF